MNDGTKISVMGLTHDVGWARRMGQSKNDGAGKVEDHDQPSRAALPPEAQGRIGEHLRRVYGEILAEPLPDKLTKLLEDLAKSERSQ